MTDRSTRSSSPASLDVRCTAELRVARLRACSRRSTGDVVVDISRVDSVDMTTLKLLAVANRVAEREGRRVVLRGGSPGVRRLLHLSHLRWMIPVEPCDVGRRDRRGSHLRRRSAV